MTKKKTYTLQDLTKEELIKYIKENYFRKPSEKDILIILSERYFQKYDDLSKETQIYFKDKQPFNKEEFKKWQIMYDKADYI